MCRKTRKTKFTFFLKRLQLALIFIVQAISNRLKLLDEIGFSHHVVLGLNLLYGNKS